MSHINHFLEVMIKNCMIKNPGKFSYTVCTVYVRRDLHNIIWRFMETCLCSRADDLWAVEMLEVRMTVDVSCDFLLGSSIFYIL